VNLFIDSSVLLAACGSTNGASSAVFELAPKNNWRLLASPYVVSEVLKNLKFFPPSAIERCTSLAPQLARADDILVLDRAAVFPVTKDRPILFSALASADVLLTLDRADFGDLLGKSFYGLAIMKPAAFLEQERATGKLLW
jgi:predicted nucleic acid-binding protein